MLSGKYAQIMATVHREREAERQGEERERSAPEPLEREEERRPSEPQPAASEPRRRYPGMLPVRAVEPDTPRPLTITIPRRPPITPLSRGRR